MEPPAAILETARRQQRRSAWLRTLTQWHWISSGLCLIGMLLFAVTGITLNHAASIGATPQIDTVEAQLPEALLESLRTQTASRPDKAPLPAALSAWLDHRVPHSVSGLPADWSEDEIYLAMPRPGGDAWISVDLRSGELLYEETDRGWISYFNDLHKGRNTGVMWRWFIDVFAVACVVFCITGLLLLQLHSSRRRSTWPLVGLGLLLPLLLALLFIH
ncbi:PepSY-associated TM helix domain-containing protein [Algiphilus sp. W345]|uniref:PepSY-associated TM helix domain-containing protein n=1 Tax=Banduia mediterranea TaxID=3075609 RepID=A0ABU2WIE8_9GAMM|nr:PepSY-associated TM helix domain-containing protein [Algiphilus sp. W345]MDT0497646.1 PepSY-associated TM helix domain-containing protein [Algiphilus sp. W345]